MNTDTPFLDAGRRVIAIEMQALSQLHDALDDNFARAVDQLLKTTGRVIVTGIGKSGHIAHKIAATLASTGTRRFAIPLIGITSRPESALGKQCDIIVTLPRAEEACGTGIVPTSSTTMTLAVGDALAVALMEHRAFTAEDFRGFHPGGKLGAQLSRVADLMHSGDALPLVSEDTGMGDALIEISQKSFGVVGVTDASGALVGIITDGDLRRHLDGLMSLTARDVMTAAPTTIGPDALAEQAVGMMNSRKIPCLFVTDQKPAPTPLGLLHIHDCLRVGLG